MTSLNSVVLQVRSVRGVQRRLRLRMSLSDVSDARVVIPVHHSCRCLLERVALPQTNLHQL